MCVARLAKKDLLKEIYVTMFTKRKSKAYRRFSAKVIAKNLKIPLRYDEQVKGTFECLTYAEVFEKLTKSVRCN